MADRVLVTGISGFLGGHIALRLLSEGYAVRGSVRHPERAAAVRSTLRRAGAQLDRLELVQLDLERDAGWPEAMAGVRYLQHVASPLTVEPLPDRNELIRPALEGTRRAVTVALEAGVERIVLTSSIAAIVYGHPPTDRAFTTADWTDPDQARAYPESKLRAEQEAWRLVDGAGARNRLAVVNPAAILGPLLGPDLSASTTLILRLLDGSVPAAPRMNFSLVDVRDVAAAQVLAMTDAEAGGRRHILVEREMSVMQIVHVLRSALPAAQTWRLPGMELPDSLVRLAGRFDARIREHLPELGSTRHLDGSSGRALLRRPLVTGPEAVLATARSLIALGLVGEKWG